MPFKRKSRNHSEPLPVGKPSANDYPPLSPPDHNVSEDRASADSISPGTDPPSDEEAYELEETDAPAAPSPVPIEQPPVADKLTPTAEPGARKQAKPAATKSKVNPQVTQLWSQWGELRHVLIIPLALVVLGGVACTPSSHVLVGVFMVLAGLAGTGYLIAVSLERPVRVTPEQGVRGYFESLDHHLPNFRRMYLLLTDGAKKVPELHTYRCFRAYWNYRLAQIRPAEEGFRPIVAKVKKFNAQYNRSRKWARATFVLEFYIRGLEDEPLASYEMSCDLVKAPDGMWYLNEGRIPEPKTRG